MVTVFLTEGKNLIPGIDEERPGEDDSLKPQDDQIDNNRKPEFTNNPEGGDPSDATESGETTAPEEQTTAPEEETGATEETVEAEPWVLQPATCGPFVVTNGVFYGSLGISLVLILCLLFAALKGGKKQKKAAPAQQPLEKTQGAAVPAAGAAGIQAAVHQHIGARKDQQDSFGISDLAAYETSGVVAVVADGMGGLANGSTVSKALRDVFIQNAPRIHPQANGADVLLDLATRANAHVNQILQGKERSGSTLVAALIRDGYLHFLTVGDSRLYLYRGGALIQLNREHIYQEELAVRAANQMTPLGQVRSDRQAHALTSYYGIGQLPAVDRNDEGLRLVNGDKLLLASDGVFGTLSQQQLEQFLALDVEEAAARIGEEILAINKPYQDNNTAVILEYRN